MNIGLNTVFTCVCNCSNGKRKKKKRNKCNSSLTYWHKCIYYGCPQLKFFLVDEFK